jgi:hypothetical protein
MEMTKVMSLVKASGFSNSSEFRDYWADDYLASILNTARMDQKITRVVHNHVVPVGIRDDAEFHTGDWAGVGETWFETAQGANEFLGSRAVAKAIAAHAPFLPEVVHLHCKELPQWDLGLETPSLKLIAFFHSSPIMTREQSQQYWTHEHVRIASALNDPTRYAPRYVQNHTLLDYHTVNPEHDFVGAPELWFHSEAAAQKLFREMDGSRMDELVADEAKFSDRKRTVSLITDEHLVYSKNDSNGR